MRQGGAEQSIKTSADVVAESLPGNSAMTCFEFSAATRCIIVSCKAFDFLQKPVL